MTTEKAESLSLETPVENSEELPPVPALESLASFNVPSPLKYDDNNNNSNNNGNNNNNIIDDIVDIKLKIDKTANINIVKDSSIENCDELSLTPMGHSNKRRRLNNGQIEKINQDIKQQY